MPKQPTSAAPIPRALRPRDAATLIILRKVDDGHQVLMGRRHEGHKFMPGKFVFPGGRVDRADSRVLPATPLDSVTEGKLLKKMRGTPSPNRARGLAMAAVRETFEETGLIIGQASMAPPRTRSADWRAFAENGAAPALHGVRFIARAITPPKRVRRFDTRFFAVDEEHIQNDPHDLSAGSDELLDLHWLSFEAARALDIPQITSIVLTELEARITGKGGIHSDRPVPFYFMRNNAFVREEL